MRDAFDPYEILGLPRGASRKQIKKRYRQLLRRHHPDVSDDPARAHEIAAELGRAYRRLMEETWQEVVEGDEFGGVEPELQVVVDRANPDRSPIPPMLAQAEQLLRQRRYEEVQLVCADILLRDPDCVAAYELLGKAYEARGLQELAREMYREVERLAGIGPQPFRQAASAAASAPPFPRPTRKREIWTAPPVQVNHAVEIGMLVVVLGLVWLGGSGTQPVASVLGLSWPKLALAMAAALSLGIGLAWSGRIATFDQELGYSVSGGGVSSPLWLLLVASACVTVFLAALVHLITDLLGERLSLSLAWFWVAVFGLCGLVWVWMGGSVAFWW
ncbi:DnaJ domain-containing protein, partial [bacterium]|nr:DnaJ domain-containing protein [bacterium]